ncbi:hypothetical protein [Nocardia jiangxiensis]|uniref:hypothetical protein n=1 Tax=Nocardia jiangxiensis TaxID=282685 RepID=UPI000306BC49|nr:hypothetical protein [Nocardia jiangxiensis]
MNENTTQEQRVRSVDDVLSGGGGPKVFAFDHVGAHVTGTFADAEMVPVYYPKDHPLAGQQKRYKQGTGNLAYQIRLILENTDDRRVDDEDDGRRRAFVKEFGDQRDAFARALSDRGFKKVSDAYGARLTITRLEDGPPPFKGGQNEYRWAYDFNSADSVLNRGNGRENRGTDDREHREHRDDRRETREEKKPKTTRDLLRDAGLPEDLAPLVGENPTPELIAALKAQHGVK